jgi:hypothetical protein
VILGACGATPREIERAVVRQAPVVDRHAVLWGEARAAWERRGDEAALRDAIARWREVVALRDDDHEAYAMLARAYFFLGDGFLVFDEDRRDELRDAFEQGVAYADRGLRALSPAYEARRRGGEDADAAIAGPGLGLGRDAVPFLYWYAQNLLRWAHAKGRFTLMSTYKSAHRVMSVVENLDPDYFYGGPDRYFATFLAGAPGIAGGDMTEARARFDASLRRAPAFFETRILIAELLAVKTHDKALYVSSLRYVLDTPAGVLPEILPEQLKAKKKAEWQLKKADERF